MLEVHNMDKIPTQGEERKRRSNRGSGYIWHGRYGCKETER